ncbi:hypothetical protein [Cellulomonas xiejunii]|uniref:Type II secretion system protein GspF domain-containing protein n=1 Tax=Cellulomonas xiejunii TaxID=2968083 RepID=A0ABY5KNH5_9CELL|nr:hypothetical protein [Cellulomonas xiejunii]MCC2315044.1 hypothetical protein [Cellulomonas xiejunii]MCC2321469.1 hypothetical protein [Cellulomonas xiejunii]MCC2323379.1 hypothetical protein [Cellulomonas xiejunii]UUI72042.1 hypothetical protein NP048_00800 [Cellulomonas xiejunii]
MTWPDRDRPWLDRYRAGVAGAQIPPDVLAQRECDLLAALLEAGEPAADVFGDPAEVAAEDVAELATDDEAVRRSEGGGARPVLQEIAGSLIGFALVAVLAVAVRHGGAVDVDAASVLVAAAVLAGLTAWRVARACRAAGRSAPAAGAVVAGAALAVAALTAASALGERVLVHDAPLLALAPVMLAPGVALLAVARSLPEPRLRDDWDDDQWLRRFRVALRARLVPRDSVRGHVMEVQETLRAQGVSAADEYGHPLVLARRLAAADRTARARRWWLTVAGGVAVPLAVAAQTLVLGKWEWMTVPLTLLLVGGAVVALAMSWGSRPWARA